MLNKSSLRLRQILSAPHLLSFFSAILLLLGIYAVASKGPLPVFPAPDAHLRDGIWIAGGALLCFLRPRFAAVILFAWTLYYFTVHTPIGKDAALALSYIVLLSIGSLCYSRRAFSRAPAENAARLWLMTSSAVTMSAAVLIPLSLLAAGKLTAQTLAAAALIWASCGAAWEWKRSGLLWLGVRPSREEGGEERPRPIDAALGVCLAAVCIFYAVMYLYPGSLAGDSDKAYAAFPRFFFLSQSLYLNEDAWTSNVMAAYHHSQEMFLASGYALGGNIGLKLFALFIVMLKLFTLYEVAAVIFNFSSVRAKAAVLSFSLIPIVVEMHVIVRPENMLSVLVLQALYYLEISRRFRRDGEIRPAHRALLFSFWLCCVAVSVKLTALYFIAACAAVYHRQLVQALRRIPKGSSGEIAVVAGGFAVFILWFARNYLLFGVLTNMPPYGTYHLTIWWPPLRSPGEVFDFITRGLTAVRSYTEYPDFGYSFWGLLFFPALFLALVRPGPARRFSMVVLLYTALLLSATRQIRYLMPVIAPFILAAFSLPAPGAGRAIRKGWAGPLCFVFAALQAALAFSMSRYTALGTDILEHLALRRPNFQEAPEPFRTINNIVRYPNRVLAPSLDYNYSFDSVMFRGDPVDSIGKLERMQREQSFSHWLHHSDMLASLREPHFNDPAFLEAAADPLVQSCSPYASGWCFRLYRFNPAAFTRLTDYVRTKKWDPYLTSIVSNRFAERHPAEVIAGEQILLPGLAHRLYRLQSIWDEGLGSFVSKDGSGAIPLAWHFENERNSVPAGKLRVERKARGAKTKIVPGIGPVTLPESGREAAEITYRVRIPNAPSEDSLLRIAFRGGAVNSRAVWKAVHAQGEELAAPRPITLPDLTTWVKAGDVRVRPGAEVDVSVLLLPAGSDEDAALRDSRFVLLPAPDSRSPKPEHRAPDEELNALRPLLSVGLPIRETERVLWVHEIFDGSASKAPRMRLRTAKENVTVKQLDQGAMLAAQAPENPGRKSYRFVLPAELSSGLAVKVFVGKMAVPPGCRVSFALRDPNASLQTHPAPPADGLLLFRAFGPEDAAASLQLAADLDVPVIASSADGEFRKELEMTVSLEGLSLQNAGVSEIWIILGRKKDGDQ